MVLVMKKKQNTYDVLKEAAIQKISFIYVVLKSRHILENSEGGRPEVFCKKVVLRNLTKFKGKHLCQSLFFNKVADLGLQLH